MIGVPSAVVGVEPLQAASWCDSADCSSPCSPSKTARISNDGSQRQSALGSASLEGYMPAGAIKFYDYRRGFGFIVAEDGSDVSCTRLT